MKLVLPERVAQQARWITPEPLNLAPELAGAPLATPARRAAAMAIDLGVVALLTDMSGAWLWAGLALVVLQLRNRPRAAPASRRLWVGWLLAALIVVLALREAQNQWQAWSTPAAAVTAARAAASAAAEAADDTADDGPAAAASTAPASASVIASTSASAPALSDAERVLQLQAELAAARQATREAQAQAKEAREARPPTLRQQLSRFLDDIGAGLGWGIVYFSLLPAWWGGQTVGKKLLRMQVVELTGKPMTVMRSLKRYGGYAAGLATGGLGFLQILWDPNRQGLHDKAAHTAVLDRRPTARRADAPAPAVLPPEPASPAAAGPAAAPAHPDT